MLARLDEAGQRGIDRRDAPGMPRQQDAVAMAHQHHHGRRDARIGAMTTGRAAQAELARHALGRRAAGAAIAVRAPTRRSDRRDRPGPCRDRPARRTGRAACGTRSLAALRYRAAACGAPGSSHTERSACGGRPRPAHTCAPGNTPVSSTTSNSSRRKRSSPRPLYGVADAGILFTWQAGFDANRMHASRAGQFARTASARAVGRALRTMC